VSAVRGTTFGGNAIRGPAEAGSHSSLWRRSLTEKPLHEWSRDQLLRQERGSPLGQEYGDQIRAEIIRRALLRNERYLLAGVIVAAISALGSMIAAIATLLALHHLR
jgi:hypothetical protein